MKKLNEKEIMKIIQDYIRVPSMSDKLIPTIQGCCALCGYPLEKELWDKKMIPLAKTIAKRIDKEFN